MIHIITMKQKLRPTMIQSLQGLIQDTRKYKQVSNYWQWNMERTLFVQLFKNYPLSLLIKKNCDGIWPISRFVMKVIPSYFKTPNYKTWDVFPESYHGKLYKVWLKNLQECTTLFVKDLFWSLFSKDWRCKASFFSQNIIIIKYQLLS